MNHRDDISRSGAPPGQPEGAGGGFNTTHWSVVMLAGQEPSPESASALENLCHTYWYPLYAFVRRQGRSLQDAEDLTQAFFANLLEKKTPRVVEAAQGRFRSFLLASLKDFLAKDWDGQHAARRGEKHSIVSIDGGTAEDRYRREPSHDSTPEKLFDQSWALTVLETVMQHLREEYTAADKAQLFEALQGHWVGDENGSYASAAAQLGIKEAALRMAVLRMSRHFGYLLRVEIAQTVTNPSDLEEELRHLVAAMTR